MARKKDLGNSVAHLFLKHHEFLVIHIVRILVTSMSELSKNI